MTLDRIAKSLLVTIALGACLLGAMRAAKPAPLAPSQPKHWSQDHSWTQRVDVRAAAGFAALERVREVERAAGVEAASQQATLGKDALFHLVAAWRLNPTSPRVAHALFQIAVARNNGPAIRAVLTSARERLPRYATFEFAVARAWLTVHAGDRSADAITGHREAFDRAMAFGPPPAAELEAAATTALACVEAARTLSALHEAQHVCRQVLLARPGLAASVLKRAAALKALGSWRDARSFLPETPESDAAWAAFAKGRGGA